MSNRSIVPQDNRNECQSALGSDQKAHYDKIPPAIRAAHIPGNARESYRRLRISPLATLILAKLTPTHVQLKTRQLTYSTSDM